MTGEIVNALLLTLLSPNGTVERHVLTDAPIRPFPATDPDLPNKKGLNRIVELPSWSEDIYADPAKMSGAVGAGSVTLANGDQALSYWSGYAFQTIEWRRGVEGQPWAQWDRVAAGRAEPPAWTLSDQQPSRLQITLIDLRDDLTDDAQSRVYEGDNSGSSGIQGGEDAAGRLVPLALGDLSRANIAPFQVNGSTRIFQFHDGAAGGVPRLYDRGGLASFAAVGDVGGGIETASLTSGQFCTDLARGLFRLGGATGGDVTVDALGAVGAGDTGPTLLSWLLRRRYGELVAMGGGFGALAAGAATLGVYLTDAVSYRDLFDLICRSDRLWCLPDAFGVWQIGRLSPPSAPMATINDNAVVRIAPDDAEAAMPVWDVEVKWGRNYSVLARQGMASAVWDTDREAFLKQEWRVARDQRAAVKARWSNARKLSFDTALTSAAAAAALVAALHDLFGPRPDGTPRLSLRVAVEMTPAHLAVPLGETVRLIYPSDGIDQPMLVMGRRIASPARHLMWWRLFG
jgi:hypothetical protein